MVPLSVAPETTAAVTTTLGSPTVTTGRPLPENATPLFTLPGWVLTVNEGVAPAPLVGVNDADSADQEPEPFALVARIFALYVVPFVSPETVAEVTLAAAEVGDPTSLESDASTT